MEHSLIFALCTFAFISSVTPGPNNIMLLASGAQYGYVRSLPHIFGIVIGVAALMVSVLSGLGVMFTVYPFLFSILKVLGSSYLLWLACKIATASVYAIEVKDTGTPKGPFKWWEAALFQFINPKAWMMAVGSVTMFSLPGNQYLESGIAIVLVFACIGFPSVSLWAGAGTKIGVLLNTPKQRRVFNVAMGLATVATLFLVAV